MSSNEIEVSVLKYDSDFTKRSKDIKKNTWFSFSNDLLLHPDFTEINGEELKWFIWIISICSKLNQNKIRLNISHAEKVLSLKKQDLFSMLEKLKQKQIDVVCDQSATERGLSATDDDRYSTTSTLHYNTLHNTTNITNNTSLVPTSNEIVTTTNTKKLIKINMPEDLAEIIDHKNRQLLFELYGDADFLKREFFKIQNWLDANPKKNHKTKRGWLTFVANWLEKGWPQYQKNIPTNKAKASSVDELMNMMGW